MLQPGVYFSFQKVGDHNSYLRKSRPRSRRAPLNRSHTFSSRASQEVPPLHSPPLPPRSSPNTPFCQKIQASPHPCTTPNTPDKIRGAYPSPTTIMYACKVDNCRPQELPLSSLPTPSPTTSLGPPPGQANAGQANIRRAASSVFFRKTEGKYNIYRGIF